MSNPKYIVVLEPVDKSIHLLAMVGIAGALVSGPLTSMPQLAGLGLNAWPALRAVHAVCAAIVLFSLLLHLARVGLLWLKGELDWGLIPSASDVGQIFSNAPYGRLGFKERIPYGALVVLAPLLFATGLFTAHFGRFSGLLGPGGVLTCAWLHAGLGLLALAFVAFHVYYSMLAPEKLWFNASFLTGRMGWDMVVAAKPALAAELTRQNEQGYLEVDGEDQKAELLSAEDFLVKANDLAAKKDFAGAVELYEEVLKHYPGYAQALFNMGAAKYKLKDYGGSKEAFMRYLKEDSFGQKADRARQLVAEMEKAGEVENG